MTGLRNVNGRFAACRPNLQRSTLPRAIEINSNNDGAGTTVLDILRDAAHSVSRELDSLQSLNTRKAVEEFAMLYDVRPVELWYFYMYGEKETERLFNISRQTLLNKDKEADVDPIQEW